MYVWEFQYIVWHRTFESGNYCTRMWVNTWLYSLVAAGQLIIHVHMSYITQNTEFTRAKKHCSKMFFYLQLNYNNTWWQRVLHRLQDFLTQPKIVSRWQVDNFRRVSYIMKIGIKKSWQQKSFCGIIFVKG